MNTAEPKIVINKVIRDDELRLKRRAWEHLRRSPDYRTDYNRLSNPHSLFLIGEDIEAYKTFCQKWNIRYTFDPRLSYDQLLWLVERYEYLPFPQRFQQPLPPDTWENLQAPERIREVLGFVFDFEPTYAEAAIVDPEEEIVNEIYLNVWVNLEWPKRYILSSRGDKGELKKILDAWIKERRGRWGSTPKEPIVVVGEQRGSIVQLLINCTASKAKIVSEVKPVISKLHASWDGQREDPERLHDAILERRLRVYDLIEGFMCEKVEATKVATLLNLPPSTVDRYHQEALEATPGKFSGTKNQRKQDGNYEAAYVPCYLGECPYLEEDGVKRCLNKGYDACPEAHDFVNQGLNEVLNHPGASSLEEADTNTAREYQLGDGKRKLAHVEPDENDREFELPESFYNTYDSWHTDHIGDDEEAADEAEDETGKKETRTITSRERKLELELQEKYMQEHVDRSLSQSPTEVVSKPKAKTPSCAICNGGDCKGTSALCEKIWEWVETNFKWVEAGTKQSKAKTPRRRYEGLVSEFSLTRSPLHYTYLLIIWIDHRRREIHVEYQSHIEYQYEDIRTYPLTHEIREKSDAANRWGIPTAGFASKLFWSIPFTLRRIRYKQIRDEGYPTDQFGRCRHLKKKRKCSICSSIPDSLEAASWKSTDFGDFYSFGDAYPNGDHCAYPEGSNDDGSSVPCGLITVEPTNFCIEHLEKVKKLS